MKNKINYLSSYIFKVRKNKINKAKVDKKKNYFCII